MIDVSRWLLRLGLADHAASFAENGVDASLLPGLTNEDLKDLGVSRLRDRKILMRAIADLAAEAEVTVADTVSEPTGPSVLESESESNDARSPKLADEVAVVETTAETTDVAPTTETEEDNGADSP